MASVGELNPNACARSLFSSLVERFGEGPKAFFSSLLENVLRSYGPPPSYVRCPGRDVCAYATCGHIASVLDRVPYIDLEAISEAYSAKQVLFDAGQWRVPDGTKTLMSVFPWDHPAIISSDRAMFDLFSGYDLSIRPIITQGDIGNVIANLSEGAYVMKIQGTANAANVIESHVQSLIVEFYAQVRTSGAFDRYIYDARDSTLITEFSSYQNASNIRFFKVTPAPGK